MKRFHLLIVHAAVLVTGLSSCKKECSSGLEINFINTTGATLNNAKADDTKLGNIVANGQTGYIHFDQFGTDTGVPDCDFTGTIGDKQLASTAKFYWCGTEKTSLTEGRYNVEITLITQDTAQYFHLRFR